MKRHDFGVARDEHRFVLRLQKIDVGGVFALNAHRRCSAPAIRRRHLGFQRKDVAANVPTRFQMLLGTTRSSLSFSAPNTPPARRLRVDCAAGRAVCDPDTSSLRSRRSACLTSFGAACAFYLTQEPVFAAKIPKGYTVVQDKTDGYQYLAPFGWQEVEVSGLDSVYKDLIEPLENVSVSLIATDKKSIQDFGPLNEVALNLADNVLTPPDQTVKIVSTAERDIEGIHYYSFEFETKASNYARHALSVVAVGNGNFYTLTTGSSERRWSKLQERLKTVVKSFQIIEPVTV